MSQQFESLHALAEALSPLSHSLAAGLLIRPVAVPTPEPENDSPLEALCAELASRLEQNVPALEESVAALEDCELDETEELVDELAAAALELVDMARRIWECPLPEQAQSLRPLLATLAEAAPAQLLLWILEVAHCAIDPWSMVEDPEKPDVDFNLRVEDTDLRKAIDAWRSRYPGVLPDTFSY